MSAEVIQIPLTTLLNLAALILYTLAVKRITFFSFVLVGLLLIDVLHQGIAIYLRSFLSDERSLSFVFHAWYISFAFTDFLFFLSGLYLAKVFGSDIDRASQFILYTYLALGVIQMLRFAERLFTDVNLMAWLYSEGIPLTNLVVTAFVIGYVIRVTFVSLRHGVRAV